jgi:hypothetical protein
MSELSCNKLSVNVLIDKLISAIHSAKIAVIQCDTNPIQLDFDGTIYNIYLRNVSHGGKSYPENTTRAQLPKHPSFDRIKSSDERFLFIGYASDSDVFVCWDPVKAKQRLNNRDYVSFFSRKSVQDAAEEGEIKKATLSNGDIFVAFKRTDFELFINVIERYFPSLEHSEESPNPITSTTKTGTPDSLLKHSIDNDVVGMLTKIENDPSVQLLIDTSINKESTIAIIAQCMKAYGSDYPNMQFKDWGKLIRKYIEVHG